LRIWKQAVLDVYLFWGVVQSWHFSASKEESVADARGGGRGSQELQDPDLDR
jgi:hypothetical protein